MSYVPLSTAQRRSPISEDTFAAFDKSDEFLELEGGVSTGWEEAVASSVEVGNDTIICNMSMHGK